MDKFKESAVIKDAGSGNLAHSLMLVSADVFALERFAKVLAQTLMCEADEKPCGVCVECRKIEHNNNVDVIEFPRNNKVINSAEIAELMELAYVSPYASDKKIFILKDASSIDIGMQNKLLKTLEEPPFNTYFLLLVTDDSKILPTIKSRCRSVFLSNIDASVILEELSKLGIEGNKAQEIVNYCSGNCSLALKYAQNDDFFKMVDLANDLIKNYRKSSQMLTYATKLYAIGDKFDEFLTIFLKNCSDAVKILCGEVVESGTAQILSKEFSVNALVEIVKGCNLIVEKKTRYCNNNAIVDSFLLMILEVRHKWPVM